MANKQVTLKRVIDTSGNTDTIHPTTDWAQVESKPSTFTPTAHTHTLSDITDSGTVAAINLNSSTTQFLRGDGTFAVPALETIGDGNTKFYAWRAINNTSASGVAYYKIAHISASQSSRFQIELTGRYAGYGDGDLPNYCKILGQLNNDSNYDVWWFNNEVGSSQVVSEVGIVDDGTNGVEIWVKVSNFSEVSATAYISDGTITTYDTNSQTSSAPTGYSATTEYKMWNSGNDGSGSGLAADTVDGIHGGSFLRSDTTDTASGNLTFNGTTTFNNQVTIDTGSSSSNALYLKGTAPTITFADDTSGADDFFLHANGNNFYILTDRDGGNQVGAGYETPHPLQLEADTNVGYLFGEVIASRNYVDDEIANLVASAPSTLDTLNELAAALGDDANFSTTVTNSLAGKVAKSGDTMTGNLTISNTNPVLQLTDTNTSGSAYIDYQGGTSLKVHAGADPIVFIAGNSEKARLTAGNGNLGIGTTNPGEKLEVNGNIKASRYYDAGNTSYYVDPASTSIINQLQVGLTGADYLTLLGTNSLQFDRDGTSYIDQKGTGNLAFRFGSSYATRMLLTNAGNLGIGTASPSERLEVIGNFKIKQSSGYSNYGLIDQTEAKMDIKTRTTNASTNPADITFQPNLTEAMRITNDGDVGIGTTSPAEKLEVVGSVRASDNFQKKGSGGYYLYNSSMGFRAALYDNGTTTAIYGDGNGSTPVIHINSDKVGIGTDNPGSKLQVNSSGTALARFFSTGNGDTHGLYINVNVTAGDVAQDNNVHFASSGSNSGSFTFATGNDERMRIASNGKVGIGTIAPGSMLHIVDTTSGSDLAKFRNDTDTTDVTIKTTSGAIAVIKSGGGDQLQLSANGTDNNGIRITSAGNVGIGETSVDTQLHISDPSGAVIKLEDPGTVAWRIGTSGTDLRISHNSDTVATSVLNIDNTGNVGVGTQSPAYAVDVAGDVNVTGNFKVNGTNIATGTAAEPEWEYVTKVTGSSSMNYASMVPADYEYKFVVELQTTGEDNSNPYIRINNEATQEYSYQYQSVTQTAETTETALNAGDALTSLIYTGADLSTYSNGGTSGSTIHRAEFIYSVSPYTTSPGAYTATIRGWAHTHWVSQSGTSYDGMVQSTFVGTRDNLFFTEHTRLDYIHSINIGSTDYHEMRVYRRPRK